MSSDCVPEEICETCASDAIFHYHTETVAAYCIHNKAGAFLQLDGTWGILLGVGEKDFKKMLVKALAKAELIGDVAQEIKKIVAIKQAKKATKQ